MPCVRRRNNASLFRDGAAETVAEMKQEPGKDMVLFGGASAAQSLLHAGLVDEYQLLVNPIVLGNGTRLFAAPSART
jgi:dihydrofolate reductase